LPHVLQGPGGTGCPGLACASVPEDGLMGAECAMAIVASAAVFVLVWCGLAVSGRCSDDERSEG